MVGEADKSETHLLVNMPAFMDTVKLLSSPCFDMPVSWTEELKENSVFIFSIKLCQTYF